MPDRALDKRTAMLRRLTAERDDALERPTGTARFSMSSIESRRAAVCSGGVQTPRCLSVTSWTPRSSDCASRLAPRAVTKTRDIFPLLVSLGPIHRRIRPTKISKKALLDEWEGRHEVR